MAAVHEIADVVKKINPALMKKLLVEKLALTIDIDWNTLTKRNSGQLVKIIESLPDEKDEIVGNLLGDIADVGRETKNIATIYQALSLLGVEYDTKEHENYSACDIACWAYTICDDVVWNRVKAMTGIENLPKGEWRSFDLEFDENDPLIGAAAAKKDALRTAIQEIIYKKERRGKHCEIDVYPVGNREYTVFKLNDHKSDVDFYDHESDRNTSQKLALLFEIVFSYDYDDNRLSVIYQTNPRRAKNLCVAWADTVFGKGCYKQMAPVQYDLTRFTNPETALLPVDAMSSISAAKVVGLDVQIGSKDRRRSYFELKRDLYAEIRNELNPASLTIDKTTVKRVKIQITYSTKKRSNITKTFSVSETAASNLSNTRQVQNLIKDYIKFLGITKNANDTTADQPVA